jgi:hypothetical protein
MVSDIAPAMISRQIAAMAPQPSRMTRILSQILARVTRLFSYDWCLPVVELKYKEHYLNEYATTIGVRGAKSTGWHEADTTDERP